MSCVRRRNIRKFGALPAGYQFGDAAAYSDPAYTKLAPAKALALVRALRVGPIATKAPAYYDEPHDVWRPLHENAAEQLIRAEQRLRRSEA
jgi:hypothetical protein